MCEPGKWDQDFYEVRPLPDEVIVTKHRYGGFENTDLDLVLRSNRIKSVIITGVATNVCVEAAARDAFMRDYYVVVVSDCTAGRDESFHRAALTNIELHFASVVTADAVAGTWKPR